MDKNGDNQEPVSPKHHQNMFKSNKNEHQTLKKGSSTPKGSINSNSVANFKGIAQRNSNEEDFGGKT